MARIQNHLRWVFAGILLQSSLTACGGEDGVGVLDNGVGGAVGAGGNNATGGVVTNGVGGQQTNGQGGTTQSAGGAATGGKASTGGAANAGGNATGGKATGGATSAGGAATGGKATGGATSAGGAATGGKATGGAVSAGGAATGGKAATGGAATGGKAATGGAATGGAATGGKAATGGAATGGAAPTTGAGPTVTCGCTTSSGEFSGNNIKSTIVVDSGENYDGGCKTFRADSGSLGAGDQAEGQLPVFRVNGGTLSNVILGASAADGIHIYGSTTLKNIHWVDIGEDAMTVKGAATMTLDCGSSKLGADKTFQVNAASTITIKNFTARSAGKFMRQNGDTTFKMAVTIDHCDIAGMSECIYRTDSSTSTVTMTNTRYSGIGDSLFIYGSTGYGNANVSGKITVSGNVAY